jgi:Ca2+-binding EF-hand superfamily protein
MGAAGGMSTALVGTQGGVEMVIRPQAFVTAVLLGLPAALFAGELGQRAQDRRPAEIRFQVMDANGDGAISRSEWRGSDQSFQRHDWNGDRVLSGNEVRLGASRDLGEEGNDYDQARPEFRNWTERGFTNVDRNRDGRIARGEWFYDGEGFIRADRNGDGALTREEFLSGDVDVDREDRFEYLDANRNGRIERTEWHASRDAFTWLDRNRDGALSRQEVVGDEAQQADLFAGLDADNDGTITSGEWQWSRRSFARQDQNGDGQLTRAELTNAELNAAAGTAGTSGQVVANGRQVTVDASRGWVDTGIDVRRGDILQIQATGTVTLSTNESDAADPSGSRTNRRAASSPLPAEPAGALIARVGNAAPMLAGGRQSITANGTGRLFLAVNDDFFDDNRGAYRVVVAVGR